MDETSTSPAPPRGIGFLTRLIVLMVLVLVAGYFGYLAIALGPDASRLRLTDFLRGEKRTLEPAELRGAPLRNGERVFLLTTQAEHIVPLLPRLRGTPLPPRHLLHADVWAFDAATARPAWRRRLRTFEGGGHMMFELFGIDAGTLWLTVREVLGVTVSDGTIVADGPRIEARNPGMAGKRVEQPGYVALGGQGLQLTLSDSTQWVVHGGTLLAEPRESAPRNVEGIVVPCKEVSYTHSLQMRGLPIGPMWLGVLTDEEAKTLQAPPVVPGRKPGARRGVMDDFLESQHVPGDLTAQPRPYRLWSARVTKVSAAPPGWSKELPDNWGTRDAFSDYKALPEAPAFLEAGLLADGVSKVPFWYREPDSVLVLHHDKVGNAGRLRVARVAGPAGRVVWDTALPLADLHVSTFGDRTVVLVGTEPNPAHDARSPVSREHHEKLVALDVPSGGVTTYDLTAESVLETAFPATP